MKLTYSIKHQLSIVPNLPTYYLNYLILQPTFITQTTPYKDLEMIDRNIFSIREGTHTSFIDQTL